MNTLSLPNKKRGRTGSNIKFADDLQDLQELEPYLCKAAFKKEPGKRKPVVWPKNCMECEVQCAYGCKYLRIWRKQQETAADAKTSRTAKQQEETKKMEAMAKEIKKLEQAKEKAEKRAELLEKKLLETEKEWQSAVEANAKASEQLMQTEAENVDLRKTVESLVKEKAVMIARLKAAERSEAELEFLQREVEKAKEACERKDRQLIRMKAKLYDHEHPEEA